MARSPLWRKVEHEGRTYWFGSADSAFTGVMKATDSDDRSGLMEALAALFVAAVRDWEVRDANGDLVPFSQEAAADMPTLDKAMAAQSYLNQENDRAPFSTP